MENLAGDTSSSAVTCCSTPPTGLDGDSAVKSSSPKLPSGRNDRIPTTKYVDVLSRQIARSEFIQTGLRSSPTVVSNNSITLHDMNIAWSSLFTRVCICDPKLTGEPIRQHSPKFALPLRALKVGVCQFLNLPFDRNKHACALTVNPGPDGRPMFLLEYTASLIDLQTGQESSVLVAETDVTTIFREAAIREILKARLNVTPKLQEAQNCESPENSKEANFNSFISRVRRASTKAKTTIYIHPNEHITLKNDYSPKISDADWDWLFSTLAKEEQDAAMTGNALPVSGEPASVPVSVLKEILDTLNYIISLHQDIFILSPNTNVPGKPYYNVTHLSNGLLPLRRALDPLLGPIRLKEPLSSTPSHILRSIGEYMAHGREVVAEGVRWGQEERDYTLFLTPMGRGDLFSRRLNRRAALDGGVECWVCFLVDRR